MGDYDAIKRWEGVGVSCMAGQRDGGGRGVGAVGVSGAVTVAVAIAVAVAGDRVVDRGAGFEGR